MGSIFSNALLTLVAAAGADSEVGMFNESSTYGGRITAPEICMDVRRRVAFRTTLPGGTIRSTLYIVHYIVSSAIYHRFHRRDGPLMSRAWCLQEGSLSPRKLYYSNDQIYWHCDHLSISEDGLIDPTKSSIGFDRHPFLDTIEESEIAWRASDAWYGALIWLDYSRRHVTEIADRLIAIAGLASHVPYCGQVTLPRWTVGTICTHGTSMAPKRSHETQNILCAVMVMRKSAWPGALELQSSKFQETYLRL